MIFDLQADFGGAIDPPMLHGCLARSVGGHFGGVMVSYANEEQTQGTVTIIEASPFTPTEQATTTATVATHAAVVSRFDTIAAIKDEVAGRQGRIDRLHAFAVETYCAAVQPVPNEVGYAAAVVIVDSYWSKRALEIKAYIMAAEPAFAAAIMSDLDGFLYTPVTVLGMVGPQLRHEMVALL